MNKILGWFKLFSAKEKLILTISTLISAMILSSLIWLQPVQQGVNPYTLLAFNIRVEDIAGKRLDPFYTIFFANYEAKTPDQERQQVTAILTEEVQRLHPYADRHHWFAHPEGEGYLANLRMLNEAYGQATWLEIDAPFYELLSEAKQLSMFTDGAFNMFLGHVSDFWDDLLRDPVYRLRYRQMDPSFNNLARKDLMTRLQYVPMTDSEIDATLELKEEQGQYLVRFNVFNDAPLGSLKISLGAMAKGFANDVMADRLQSLGLTRGYISNGTSSITTMGPRYGNVPYRWQLTSPHPSARYALTIEKPGRHSLSTSGAYTGFVMPVGSTTRLRHHIIDPKTGYPSQQAIELNVISSSYSAAGLDALSTAFMTMTQTEAMMYRQQILEQGHDLEIAWVEVKDDRVHVTYTEGYETIMTKEANVQYRVYRP
jgi:thiamine biosynthesis lipoprotein ApbE